MTGRRGSRHRASGDEGGVVGVVRDRGRNSPGLDYSVRWVSGRDEGGFGKGFGLSLCAVPLTQLVPHLGLAVWLDDGVVGSHCGGMTGVDRGRGPKGSERVVP
jgi:hypothetical protein